MDPKPKRACPPDKFDAEVVALPGVIADSCLAREFPLATRPQQDWFRNLADWWTRYFYANDEKWNRELKKHDPHPFLHLWIGHWAKAFAHDPDSYVSNHRQANADSPDPEWNPGGSLVA